MLRSVKDLIPGDAELLFDALSHLTVGRVVNFLNYTFDCSDHEILDRAELRQKWVTTPLEYAVDHCEDPASGALIVFYGGPPGDGEWYPGSMLALLVDRLLYNRAIGNSEVVRRFMGAVANG
jgi:hypothetical protein